MMIITAETIRTIREVKRWSQRYFAKEIGCSYSLISRIEAGDRTISKQLQRTIIDKLNLTEHKIEYFRQILNQIEAV